MFDGKLLCNFASLEHTRLVPICDVMPGEPPTVVSVPVFILCVCHQTIAFYQKHSAFLPVEQLRAPSEQSEFVFCLQREQRAFCVDVSLVFESQVRYSGSLFSTLAY